MAQKSAKNRDSHPKKFHIIISFPRPHPDTIAAVLLLKLFGEKRFPGIKEAKVEFMSQMPKGKTWEQYEQEGVLLIDIGEGRFDHHQKGREKTFAARLVAEDLGIEKDPALGKLLEYVRRDDQEGKGTLSTDKIDRAFGLSGLIMALNREYPDAPGKVVDIVRTIFFAHLKEEIRRTKTFPQEFEKAQKEKRFELVGVSHQHRTLRVAFIQSDVQGIVGFLRAYGKVKADLVVQRFSSGHTNIITNQNTRVDLRDLLFVIRTEEARRNNTAIEKINWNEWLTPGRLELVPQWYYDTAANSIQNGGIHPEGVPPTKITFEEMKDIVEVGLNETMLAEVCPKNFCIKRQCYFYPYGLQRCRKIRFDSTRPLREQGMKA